MGWPLLGDDGSLMLMQLAAGLLSLRAWENDAGVCATQLTRFDSVIQGDEQQGMRRAAPGSRE